MPRPEVHQARSPAEFQLKGGDLVLDDLALDEAVQREELGSTPEPWTGGEEPQKLNGSQKRSSTLTPWADS